MYASYLSSSGKVYVCMCVCVREREEAGGEEREVADLQMCQNGEPWWTGVRGIWEFSV